MMEGTKSWDLLGRAFSRQPRDTSRGRDATVVAEQGLVPATVVTGLGESGTRGSVSCERVGKRRDAAPTFTTSRLPDCSIR